MSKLQIKINGEWLALPQDFSISMEQSSPVFNEQGTFSFPFEVPYEPNKHVFRNLADPHGHITLHDINGLDAELWFDGILLYKGKTETEEEAEITDSVPMTFISGNSDFLSRIEGMNARDVPLDRQVAVGTAFTKFGCTHEKQGGEVMLDAPTQMMVYEQNISLPYPFPYCNARVCTTQVDKDGNIEGYCTLDAYRPYSGVCFYVLYFIEVLMEHLGIAYDKTDLTEMEDMTRLAFWMTKCEHDLSEEEETWTPYDVRRFIPTLEVVWETQWVERFETNNGGWTEILHTLDLSDEVVFKSHTVYANSQNFPDVGVSEIIDGLTNAFGVRFIYDDQTNRMRAVYLKDIFRDNEVIDVNAELLDMVVTQYRPKGYKVTYGVDDDTNFLYTDYSNVSVIDSYFDLIRSGLTRYDTTCYIDPVTGNAYRVKVDKEDGEHPVLFEVGGYNPYTTEGASDEPEELSIPFKPVVMNDTNFQNEKEAPDEMSATQELSVYADVELRKPDTVEFKFDARAEATDLNFTRRLKMYVDENYDTENEDESPLRTFDTGFTLGVMRGPGKEASLDIIHPNYDGEGNDSWTYTAGNYAFTADSIDNYGRDFDYNGTEAGGVDTSGRFSLKLVAGKPGQPIAQQHAGRGLVAKFLPEYLYFMEHKKLLTFDVKMSISDIIHVNFLKQSRLDRFVGRLNKITYTLGMDEVRDVRVEMYSL